MLTHVARTRFLCSRVNVLVCLVDGILSSSSTAAASSSLPRPTVSAAKYDRAAEAYAYECVVQHDGYTSKTHMPSRMMACCTRDVAGTLNIAWCVHREHHGHDFAEKRVYSMSFSSPRACTYACLPSGRNIRITPHRWPLAVSSPCACSLAAHRAYAIVLLLHINATLSTCSPTVKCRGASDADAATAAAAVLSKGNLWLSTAVCWSLAFAARALAKLHANAKPDREREREMEWDF